MRVYDKIDFSFAVLQNSMEKTIVRQVIRI